MFFARYAVLSALILQLVLGPTVFTPIARAQTSSSDSSDPLSREQNDIIRVGNELEKSNDGDLPRKTTDAFLLTEQRLSIATPSAEYSLSSLDLNLPEMVVTDLEKEVEASTDETGSLVFSLKRNGQVVAKHTIQSAKPIALARDRELLVFLDQGGTYRAIDMGYAKTALFRSPIPVISLLTSTVDFAKAGRVSLQFLKRDQAPYALSPQAGVMPVDQAKQIMKAGDLIVTAESAQGTVLVEELARSVMRTQLYTAETVLSFVAMRLNPEQFEAEMAQLKQVQEAAKVLSQATEGVDPFVKAAIQAIPADAMAALKARAAGNLKRVNERVDQFTFEEWQSHYEQLEKKIQAEEARVEIQTEKRSPREWLTRFMTPKTMKVMAALTVGGAVTYGAVQALGGEGPAWAVHLMNEVYQSYIPAVLKDATYRVTLLKSSIALGAFIPLLWSAGFLGAKKTGKSWKPAKMIASMGMKIYAAIQLPFYHRLANLTNQRSFLNAMRLGLNPLQKVKADSELGRQLGLKSDIVPAVNNPLWKKSQGDQAKLKSAATQALVRQEERATTLSWMLASVVASEEVSVDPATLAVLGDQAQSGGLAMSPEMIEKYLDSKEFRTKWEQVAMELEGELRRLKDPALSKGVEEIAPEELERLYSIAKQTQTEIQSRGKIGQKLADLRRRWKRVSTSSLRGVADFGLAENKFLRNVEASDFVVSQFWKQFLIDYSLAVVQMGVVGARADLSDPQALAASENGILWTTPGHFADMFGQVRVYGISVPASMALNYQRAAELIEEAYRPVEDTSLVGLQKTEGFWKGMASWAKGAANLAEADYGAIWVRRFVKTLKTIQAGYLMSTIERVFVGGQHFTDANFAFIYSTIWATWQYGWMWEPITRGNQMYQDHLEAGAKTLTESKSTLGTALRLNDPASVGVQIEAIQRLYQESSIALPKELNASIDEMFERLEKVSAQEIMDFDLSLGQNREQIAAMRNAIVQGDGAALATAREQLLNAYRAGGTENEALTVLMKLNAVSLLEFSLKNPPYAIKPHGGVEWFTTMLGAVLTTYYATSLSVDTFREDVSWGSKIGHAAMLSVGLYAGTYYAPRIWKKWVAPAIKKNYEGVCNLILVGKFRSN